MGFMASPRTYRSGRARRLAAARACTSSFDAAEAAFRAQRALALLTLVQNRGNDPLGFEAEGFPRYLRLSGAVWPRSTPCFPMMRKAH